MRIALFPMPRAPKTTAGVIEAADPIISSRYGGSTKYSARRGSLSAVYASKGCDVKPQRSSSWRRLIIGWLAQAVGEPRESRVQGRGTRAVGRRLGRLTLYVWL